MLNEQDDAGVSPVVGIILMVAVTVALVALAANFVFGIGNQSSSSATAAVQISADAAGDNISAQLIKNSSADTVSVEYTGDSEQAEEVFDGVGGVIDLDAADGDVVDVIVRGEIDGQKQVLQTREIQL